MRGAAAIRIVTRDVSLRLGQRVAAQCLELPLDASLEALTIIAPVSADGSLPTFEVEGPLVSGGVAWSDAGGRHRVIMGAPEQASQLPERLVRNAELLWWVEGTAQDSHDALVVLEESGKMILWAGTSGQWAQLSVEEPRRG
jgi:hypothetical protein